VNRFWLVFLVAATLVVVGCQASPAPTPSPTPVSGIEGRVLTLGGLLVSGSPSPRPYPASKVTVTDSTGSVVATVKAKADGSYRLELSPGTYTLKATPTAGNPWFPPKKVKVQPDRFIHADLVAQIR
jgi:hypothetical protein